MIAITGATGHLGSQIVAQLAKKINPAEIVAIVRNEEKASDLKELGVNIRVADYHNTEALKNALSGVEKVMLVSSSDFNDRLQQHKNVVDAAKNAGVKHIVYTGMSMNNVENSVLKDFMSDHYRTDEYIKNSGLDYTLLQHNLYAEVVPMFLGENVTETGIFFPAGSGKIPFALRREMAEAAANVLVSNDHVNKTYRINSNESYDFNTVAKAIGQATGKPVSYTDADPGQFKAALESMNLPAEVVGLTTGFAAAMKNDDFNVVSNDLEKLLGRKPAGATEAMAELFGKN
jgi:NAD(P)H dehydrogenase (quinone)